VKGQIDGLGGAAATFLNRAIAVGDTVFALRPDEPGDVEAKD